MNVLIEAMTAFKNLVYQLDNFHLQLRSIHYNRGLLGHLTKLEFWEDRKSYSI